MMESVYQAVTPLFWDLFSLLNFTTKFAYVAKRTNLIILRLKCLMLYISVTSWHWLNLRLCLLSLIQIEVQVKQSAFLELTANYFCFSLIETPIDNNRYDVLRFPIECDTMLHGFAGYFEAVLYKDVMLSINPKTHSPGMFSWFSIFFPLLTPVNLKMVL